MLTLVKPDKTHEAAALAYIAEHGDLGEGTLHGASWLDAMPYDDWLTHIKNQSDPATTREGLVPSSTFFAVDEAGEIVGVIDIRHYLNDALAHYGGHIGYGVRPSARGRGHAKKMLALALEHCRTLGITEVMVCCDSTNTASAKVIKANGGRLTREFLHDDGRFVQVYVIEIGN